MSLAQREEARVSHLLAEYERRIRLLKAHRDHIRWMVAHGAEDRIQPRIEGHNSWKADEGRYSETSLR